MGILTAVLQGVTSFAEFMQIFRWDHIFDYAESLIAAHPILLPLIGISAFAFTMLLIYGVYQNRIYKRKVENALKKIERNRYQNY
ncbi:MAG: hypothetical protein ACI4Q9_01040 [Candidatus Methanomethylophilaceae archaeon]